MVPPVWSLGELHGAVAAVQVLRATLRYTFCAMDRLGTMGAGLL